MRMETYRLHNEADILSPALIFYQDIIKRNIRSMITIAGDAQRLWPHVKTHKSADMVRLQMQYGIDRFKCATIAEAEMAASCGAHGVIVAYPLTGPNIQRFIRLVNAYPNTAFFAIGDDEGQLRLLSEAALHGGVRVNVLIDINDGMNRTGVTAAQAGMLFHKLKDLPGLKMRGLHIYDGHRHETSLAERQASVDRDMPAINALRKEMEAANCLCDTVVMGGTPSFPCHAKYRDVSLSPGTCVVHDYGYAAAYPDLPFTIGAMLLTRVVSHPTPDTFTVDLGSKGVAADPAPVRAVIAGYEDAQTVLQSEEHWVLRMPKGRAGSRPAIGQALYAAPVHICPTTMLYPSVLVAQGGDILCEWPVSARNRRLTL